MNRVSMEKNACTMQCKVCQSNLNGTLFSCEDFQFLWHDLSSSPLIYLCDSPKFHSNIINDETRGFLNWIDMSIYNPHQNKNSKWYINAHSKEMCINSAHSFHRNFSWSQTFISHIMMLDIKWASLPWHSPRGFEQDKEKWMRIRAKVIVDRDIYKKAEVNHLPWKDETGPLSISPTLELFQKLHWENFWEMGWSAYMGFPKCLDTILTLTFMNWTAGHHTEKNLEISMNRSFWSISL